MSGAGGSGAGSWCQSLWTAGQRYMQVMIFKGHSRFWQPRRGGGGQSSFTSWLRAWFQALTNQAPNMFPSEAVFQRRHHWAFRQTARHARIYHCIPLLSKIFPATASQRRPLGVTEASFRLISLPTKANRKHGIHPPPKHQLP